jgi:hypothetical protein
MAASMPVGREAAEAALGLSIHTGWAAAVIAAGTVKKPHLALRERVDLLGQADRFVYHMAAELAPAAGRRTVARAEKLAAAAADRVLADLVARATAAGLRLARCAIVAGDAPQRPYDEIVAAHPRIHTAEGAFYRDILRDACDAAGIAVAIIPPRQLDDSPALAAVGKSLGKPWGKDQRLAAAAAWIVLGQ